MEIRVGGCPGMREPRNRTHPTIAAKVTSAFILSASIGLRGYQETRNVWLVLRGDMAPQLLNAVARRSSRRKGR
jgi:hypothetical protein